MNSRKSEFICEGRIHFCDRERLFFSRGKVIYEKIFGAGIRKVISLESGILEELGCKFQLFLRLTRSHVHHVIPVGNDHLLVFLSGYIYYIDTKKASIVNRSRIRGSQPLQISATDEQVYYGEYIRNRRQPPIHLLVSNPPYTAWQEILRLDFVRHIHGVFKDPYNDSIWITTGDEDSESWIIELSSEDYSLKKQIGGNQNFRAVTLLFTREYIYYGTDAPDKQNYICRLHRETGRQEFMISVGGPVFYGTITGNRLFFSTACEPGTHSETEHAEIWGSVDGENWLRYVSLKKDFWHNKLFRYGMIYFPAGPGDEKHLWYSSMATENENKIFRLPLDH